MLRNRLLKLIKKSQRGSIMLFFVLLLPVLFGFMGLAIDFGLAYVQKGKLQDVADATALAAAAHLGEEDAVKMDKLKAAIQSALAANGTTVGDSALVAKEYVTESYNASGQTLAAEWATPVSLTAGQNVAVEYGIVGVTKDGNTVDRVRVRITKRSPVFFLGVLGDFSDGLVVNAKAAAEGDTEISEQEFLKKGPGLVAYDGDIYLYSNQVHGNDTNNGKGLDKEIFVNGNFIVETKNDKFQTEKDIYAKSITDGGVNFKSGSFQEIPNDISTAAPYIKSMLKDVEVIQKWCNETMANNNPKAFTGEPTGNQIFIDNGVVKPSGFTPEEGKAYDVYIDANSNMDYQKNGNYSIVNNLYGITNINNLYISCSSKNGVILNTSNVKYNNVFVDGSMYVEGKNNVFTGRTYTADKMYVLGDGNRFCQLLSKEIHIGRGFGGTAQPDSTATGGNWKFILDARNSTIDTGETGSGSPGGSSGSTIVSKLRLVE